MAHDFRCPPGSDYTMADVYAQTMEQIALVDRLGLDLVWFSEHHFVEDGYLPNFVPVAAAAAAITSNIRIGTDIALAPFAHPLRLAEDMGILDQLSGGRMELGLGLGYAPHEFAAFGMPRSHRVSYTEETIEIMQAGVARRARSPSTASAGTFDDVRSRRSRCSRAARRCGWPSTSPAERRPGRALRHQPAAPGHPTSVVLDPWRDDAAAGRDPEGNRIGIIRSVLVTDDPERDWPPVQRRRALPDEGLRRLRRGRRSRRSGHVQPHADRIPQRIIVGDVAHCVDELCAFVTKYGLTDVVTWGAVPGLAPAALTPMIERFATEVVPEVKARLTGAVPTA